MHGYFVVEEGGEGHIQFQEKSLRSCDTKRRHDLSYKIQEAPYEGLLAEISWSGGGRRGLK